MRGIKKRRRQKKRDKIAAGEERLQRNRGDFWTEQGKVTLPESVSPEKEVPYKKSKKNQKNPKKP